MHTASGDMQRASTNTTEQISEQSHERQHAEAAEKEAAHHSQVMHLNAFPATSLGRFPIVLAKHTPAYTVT